MIHKGLYAYHGQIGPLMPVHELVPSGHLVKIYMHSKEVRLCAIATLRLCAL